MSVYMKQARLLQPNSVTFGQFSITPIQDNILTLINEKLQAYMTTGVIQYDLLGMPYVEINCNEAGGKGHKALVIKNLIDLGKKTFKFRWTNKNLGKNVNTTGVVISAFHEYEKSSNIGISLNPWAIPFLLYYGEGVGGTWYNKQTALFLRGDKTKRIYKIICSIQNMHNGVYDYSIKQFSEDLQLGPSYTNAIIRKRILEPAKKEINSTLCDLFFEYELITKYPKNNKRKPMADTIRFRVNSTRKGIAECLNQKEENFVVYRWLLAIFQDAKKTDDTFETIMNSEFWYDIKEKIAYWEGQVKSGEITSEHAKNKIKKVLREDFGIQ